jgi:hypothetical protein
MIRKILVGAFLLHALSAQAFELMPLWLKQFLQAEIGRQSPWYPQGAGTNSSTQNVERYARFDQEMARLLSQKGLLQVSVYRVPVTAVKIASTGEIPMQFVDGLKHGYVKLYVHPSAMNFYAEWLKKHALNFESPEIVWAHQTSSMRSMYILPTRAGEEPLIVKSSLPEVIGGHVGVCKKTNCFRLWQRRQCSDTHKNPKLFPQTADFYLNLSGLFLAKDAMREKYFAFFRARF